MTKEISPKELRSWLLDDHELALVDVREEGVFGADGHLLFAICLPMSRLELDILSLIPRKSVRMVLCDGGDGLAKKAADKLRAWGYSDLSILSGGVPGWAAAGNVIFRGVNVPSKAFGEFIEIESRTPNISAVELKEAMDNDENIVVLDSRPFNEYNRMNIPSAIDCPGAELVYRAFDLVDDEKQKIIVNCAGRTRSIIGAQSLINAGVPNQVVALRNGTMGWALEGFPLETGSDRTFSNISQKGMESALVYADRVAQRFGVEEITTDLLQKWQKQKNIKSLFLLDVRNPDEYEEGHLPGSISAPGGQLVQATDKWAGVLKGYLILIDDNGVRATMTASWLKQMGWPNVFVLRNALNEFELEKGFPQLPQIVLDNESIVSIKPKSLLKSLNQGLVTVVDVATSLEYKASHIPGSWWAIRSRLEETLSSIPGNGGLVFTSSDGTLAAYAAADALLLTDRDVKLLEGGTDSWRSMSFPEKSGFENMADINNDIQYKAYDHDDNVETHMEEYLSWETGLVEQVERDGTAHFKYFPS